MINCQVITVTEHIILAEELGNFSRAFKVMGVLGRTRSTNLKHGAIVFIIVFLAVFFRSYGHYINPQLFNEDRTIYFSYEYNKDHIYFDPTENNEGYIAIIPQLVAFSSQLFPVKTRAYIFSVFPLFLYVATFSLMASRGIFSKRFNILFVLYIALLPIGYFKFESTLTLGIWVAPFLLYIFVVYAEPESKKQAVFQCLLMSLLIWTHPFSIIFLIYYFVRIAKLVRSGPKVSYTKLSYWVYLSMVTISYKVFGFFETAISYPDSYLLLLQIAKDYFSILFTIALSVLLPVSSQAVTFGIASHAILGGAVFLVILFTLALSCKYPIRYSRFVFPSTLILLTSAVFFLRPTHEIYYPIIPPRYIYFQKLLAVYLILIFLDYLFSKKIPKIRFQQAALLFLGLNFLVGYFVNGKQYNFSAPPHTIKTIGMVSLLEKITKQTPGVCFTYKEPGSWRLELNIGNCKHPIPLSKQNNPFIAKQFGGPLLASDRLQLEELLVGRQYAPAF